MTLSRQPWEVRGEYKGTLLRSEDTADEMAKCSQLGARELALSHKALLNLLKLDHQGSRTPTVA